MSERTEFFAWYEEQKSVVFNNTQTLESYCQEDVSARRQACQVFRSEFTRVGNINVYQESVTISSACNKVLRKLFLKPYARVYWIHKLQPESCYVVRIQGTDGRMPYTAR
jgi:hypothetical protein